MKPFLTLIVLSLALCSPFALADEKKAAEGEGNIEFSLKDLDGKLHKSADMKDKIIVLEWTENGCPAVKPLYKAKKVQEAAAALKKKGVQWCSVCSADYNAVAGLKKFKESYKVDHKILQDFDGKFGKKIGAKRTPHVFVIKNGEILYQGAFDDRRSGENYVVKAVDEILAGKEVSTPRTRAYG